MYLNKFKQTALLLLMASILGLCFTFIAKAQWQTVLSADTSMPFGSISYTTTYPPTSRVDPKFLTDSFPIVPNQPYHWENSYFLNPFTSYYMNLNSSALDLFNGTLDSPQTTNNPFRYLKQSQTVEDWSWVNPYYQQNQFSLSMPVQSSTQNVGWYLNNLQPTYNFFFEVPSSENLWKDQNLKTPGVSNVQIDIQEKTKEEENIMEATFRYQLLHDQYKTKVYFLSRGQNQDPTDEFMNRFEGYEPPVKKVSESSKTATGGVIDSYTGEKGVIFNIQSIMWISESEVHVEGDDYFGNVGASGSIYYLKKENGKWIVVEDRMHWIA